MLSIAARTTGDINGDRLWTAPRDRKDCHTQLREKCYSLL